MESLQLVLLNNENILREKQHQIKQHTHEQASTTQRTEGKNRAIQRLQTLRIFQKENVNGKRKNDSNRIMTNNKGYSNTRDQHADYEL